MNNFKLNFKTIMIFIVLFIVLLSYNTILFVSCGFLDHNAAFWCSYIFVHLSIISFSICVFVINNRKGVMRDSLLGIPILKHCIIYFIIEMIFSIIFMILDNKVNIFVVSFVIQFIALIIHLLFVISCFVAKKTIEEIQVKTEQKTFYINSLKVDAEMIAQKTDDEDIKKAYIKLSEQIRYSDPISSEELVEIEDKIKETLQLGGEYVSYGDKKEALECCDKLKLLLIERNKKCMIYKTNRVGK